MNVRTAGSDDLAAIAEVADRSLEASYALSPDQIETLVERAFSEEALTESLEADDTAVFVAEGESSDGEGSAVVGFATVDLDAGVLQWLHVHPDNRGAGVGTALFDGARDAVSERTHGRITAHVLEAGVEGDSFLEQFGLTQVDTDEYEVGGEVVRIQVYGRDGDEHDANEPAVEIPEAVEVGGRRRPVERDDPIPGREAPLFQLRESDGGEEHYGFLCGNCGSADVNADGLDRLNCGECGNEHVADNWDDAYL